MNRIITTKRRSLQSGIYAMLTASGECKYVGQTNCFRKRWKDHTRMLRAGRHYNFHLQRVWNKYGEKNLKFVILEVCENDHDDLTDREDYWIDQLMPECNIMKSAAATEYKYFPAEKKDYKKWGERFYRPKWQLWVYGGHKKEYVEKNWKTLRKR
jgi:group I intron endonuclease